MIHTSKFYIVLGALGASIAAFAAAPKIVIPDEPNPTTFTPPMGSDPRIQK